MAVKQMIRWRYLLSFFVLITILGLGVVFRSWMFTNWLQPLALVLWAILRIFLSVHQSFYWMGLIFLTFFLALRILPQKAEVFKRYPNAEGQAPVNRVDDWYHLIQEAPKKADRDQALKKALQNLVDEWQAIETSTTSTMDDDLLPVGSHSQIPLSVAHFLDSKQASKKALREERIRIVKNRLRASFLRWSPWQTHPPDEYADAIEQVISFIETNMEIEIDD